MKKVKTNFIIILTLILSFLLISCAEPVKEYTVTIDENYIGGSIHSLTVKENSLLSEVTYERENYHIAYLTKSKDTMEEFDMTTPIIEDVTLYIIWELNTYIEAKKPSFPNVRDEITVYKDITYKTVSGKDLKMDFYMPIQKENEKVPVLFFYYGGAWIMGSKSDVTYFSFAVEEINKLGVAIVCVDYRLATSTLKYPYPVNDCMDAIRYVVKYSEEIGIDTTSMGSTGYSAGGHLALMTAFAQNHFYEDPFLKDYKFTLKYVVDFFGPAYYDLGQIKLLSTVAKYILSFFYGTDSSLRDPGLRYALPSTYVQENNPNVLIIHGLLDSLVPVEQSIAFNDYLINKGRNSTLILVENAEHTLNPASGYNSVNPSFSSILESMISFVKNEVTKE